MNVLTNILQMTLGVAALGMGVVFSRMAPSAESRLAAAAHWSAATTFVLFGCGLIGFTGRLPARVVWSGMLIFGGLLFAWIMFRAARAYIPYKVSNDWRLTVPMFLPLVMMSVLALGVALKEVPAVAGWITVGIIAASWVLNLAMIAVKQGPAKAAVLNESK